MRVTILELRENYQGNYLVKHVDSKPDGFNVIKAELFSSFEKGSAKPWNKMVCDLLGYPLPYTHHHYDGNRDLWVSFS